MVERIKSGIIGLDELIEGGFVKGSVIYVTGKTGTGKTSFAASFIYAGCIRGERGVYVTTEEREEDVKDDIMSVFNVDLRVLEERRLLSFVSLRPTLPSRMVGSEDIASITKLYVYDLMNKIENEVFSIKASRVVIDSMSIIETFIKDDYLRKVALMQIINKLKELGVTALLTGTIKEDSEALSESGIIEFLVDAVIKLDFVPVAEEFKRTLTIRKMRRTNHSVYIHPFEIRKEGIKIIEV
ncbi:MAG: ATPase domain-containing protein [Candidatus Aenigmarchaeota archaeon]|nr:ATPase [Candidatus Aenigmarchaeota archaeon]MDW8149617.1 ATPase domain-containing protein [Candidatus Aenigmarchaeota archaeon]